MEGKLTGGDGVMSENLWERYGPYSKKRGKKRSRFKERGFLRQSSEWMKWKIRTIGDASFYYQCVAD